MRFLRDAELADLPRIVEIYNASIAGRMATADTEPVTTESRQVWFEAHNRATRPLWVLLLDDEIAGWVSLSSFYGRPAYHATAEVSVYVAPEHQGRGWGTHLLRSIMDECPKLGVTTLLGFVFAHNEPSLQLNRKLGFEQWGFLPAVAQLDGVPRDVVIVGYRVEEVSRENS